MMRSTWSEQPMTTASSLTASARTKPWPGTGPQTFTAAWPIRPSASPSTTKRTPPTPPISPQPASSPTPAPTLWRKSPQNKFAPPSGRANFDLLILRGRRWTQPEHVEAAGTAEFRVGAGETRHRKRGATIGGTRVWGGVEPRETIPNAAVSGVTGSYPNRAEWRPEHQRRCETLQNPPRHRVEQDSAAISNFRP